MASKYHVGMLDQRVDHQRATRLADGAGGHDVTWVSLGSPWAHVKPQSGMEREQSDRVEQQVKYLVVIRNEATVIPDDTFVWEGYRLRVLAIKLVPRSPWLEIDCVLGAAT